jgi:ABC-type protease/lipase transport system fused ATPase/permease subunit
MASERLLIQRLKKAFRPDQTVIITTHRYNMLALVDRLIVLDNGRIVADGPREEILARLSRGVAQPAPAPGVAASITPAPMAPGAGSIEAARLRSIGG